MFILAWPTLTRILVHFALLCMYMKAKTFEINYK